MSAWPEALEIARGRLVFHRPYLATVLYSLQPVSGFDLPTLAIDAKLRLFYSKTALDWPSDVLLGTLYHETLHVLRDHCARYERVKNAYRHYDSAALTPMIWNVAADCEINQYLGPEGFILPEGALTPELMSWPKWRTAEYYAQLYQRSCQSSTFTIGDGQCQSGQGVQEAQDKAQAAGRSARHICGGLGTSAADDPGLEEQAHSQGASGLPPSVVQRIIDAVAGGVFDASDDEGGLEGPAGSDGKYDPDTSDAEVTSKSRGTAPGHLVRWARSWRDSRYDWKRELSGAIGDLRVHDFGEEPSYWRPSRRQAAVPDAVLAGRVDIRPNVGVVLDSSGSMEGRPIQAAVNQAQPIIEAAGGSIVWFTVDTLVHAQKVLRSADRIDTSGGGGTDMRVGITAALAHRPALGVIIVLTDGMTPWPDAVARHPRIVAGIVAPDRSRYESIADQVTSGIRRVYIGEG